MISHNGDAATSAQHVAAMAQLWAEDATLVLNDSATFTGKPAIVSFFANGAAFANNWISLAPTFRTEIAIQGDTAEIYLECILLNENKTVVAERALSGTPKKGNGKWLFWRIDNNPATPLF